MDGQGRPGAAEVERLIGDWISVVNIDDASEASNIGHATGLQAGIHWEAIDEDFRSPACCRPRNYMRLPNETLRAGQKRRRR